MEKESKHASTEEMAQDDESEAQQYINTCRQYQYAMGDIDVRYLEKGADIRSLKVSGVRGFRRMFRSPPGKPSGYDKQQPILVWVGDGDESLLVAEAARVRAIYDEMANKNQVTAPELPMIEVDHEDKHKGLRFRCCDGMHRATAMMTLLEDAVEEEEEDSERYR